ncbi:hypothetical protein LTR09_004815 [Extremus antarcticus]|uniref:Uncharacterized protein n=1 Tax=Extremus antarcticus TaxID=702011 RepID=A0AAJ0G946_9PEZI|nr:hypothetical protein LTR09_004815 [Extremus antarcticus]
MDRRAGCPAVIAHPSPGLEALQGAYIHNIAKLERTAEEMSNSGSDLGEEIRRLSRGNSVRSENTNDVGVPPRPGMMDRVGSTRSNRSNSYGVNNNTVTTARWGGYSPGGYVTSPVGSGSGSWSHASLSRVQSGSKPTRLALVSEPMQEGRPLDSPLRPSFSVHEKDQEAVQEPAMGESGDRSRDPSGSSFAQRYDEIAGQIAQSLEHVPPSPPMRAAQLHHQQALQHLEVGGEQEPPERPHSSDTYREAQTAFKDFDGVHFSPDTDEYVAVDQAGNEVRRVSARSVSGGISMEAASMLRTAHDRPISFAPPPPDENMVYYPAPVPRMLNLPKRLSQLPSANVQAKRRSQVLGTVPHDARAGAPWLAQQTVDEEGNMKRGHNSAGSGSSGGAPKGFLNERMSANLSNLPPQLRANMYFEHQPVQHDVEMKDSAVATLDSILAASATAPVHAFTDHPFAGDVRRDVYSMERPARKSTATLASVPSPEQQKLKKRRSSSIGALLRRVTSSDQVTDTLKKRSSRASILTDFNDGSSKLKKRQSQLSLGTQLDQEGGPVQTPSSERDLQSGLIAEAQNADAMDPDDDYKRVSKAPTVMSSGYKLDDADLDEDFKDPEAEADPDDPEPTFVQPSTLLAELQVRKAQLKSRTKTAATAFPQGMHSTLLQLDAVEAINQRKRQQQRIALAWEDPHQRALQLDLDKDDEDVPLGMLFPGKDGKVVQKREDGRGFERPLGLMEKRQIEDEETLGKRRMRLMGGEALRRPLPNQSQLDLGYEAEVKRDEEGEDEAEDEGETLGQRLRRLKTKTELDGAIIDITGDEERGLRPVSGLVDDVMSQFGGLDTKDKDKDPDADGDADAAAGADAPPPDEEETLGQRRARLQREREAAAGERPPLRSATSLANLLTAHPVGQRQASKLYEPAQGSLLHSNERLQAKHKGQLQATNLGMDMGLGQQGGYAPGAPAAPAQRGLVGQQHSSRAPAGGLAGGMYNNGMGGILPNQPPTTPMGGVNGYFASPTAAMNGYGYPQTPGMGGYTVYQQQQQYPMMQQQQQAYRQHSMQNPLAYQSAPQGMNGFSNAMMGGGTYASLAQNQGLGAYGGGTPMGSGMGAGAMGMGGGMPMGMGMSGLDYDGLNPNQKAAIDRWRLSVAQQ